MSRVKDHDKAIQLVALLLNPIYSNYLLFSVSLILSIGDLSSLSFGLSSF